jgi:hypothetical protein
MGKEFFIPLNVPSSKNSKIWTGKFLVWSKAAQKYRRETSTVWKALRNEFIKEFILKEQPVKISFKFIRGTRHKFDYTGPLETIQDIMKEFKWIEDDNSDILFPVLEQYEYDKKNSGVIIKIL